MLYNGITFLPRERARTCSRSRRRLPLPDLGYQLPPKGVAYVKGGSR